MPLSANALQGGGSDDDEDESSDDPSLGRHPHTAIARPMALTRRLRSCLPSLM